MVSSTNCVSGLIISINLVFIVSLICLSFKTVGVVFPSYYSQSLKKSEMLVGSRPPGCVNKCSNCRPCIATLVIPPHERKDSRASYDKDDSYYLLTWKCKCGNKLFQP